MRYRDREQEKDQWVLIYHEEMFTGAESIVSYCSGYVPCTGPVPGPMQCDYVITAFADYVCYSNREHPKSFDFERKGLEFQEMGFNPILMSVSVFVIAKAITSTMKRPLDLLRCSVKRFCVIFPYSFIVC